MQVRVAMRDAELFSLSFACTQRPHYVNCLWRHAPAGHPKDCSAFGSLYKTIPARQTSTAAGSARVGRSKLAAPTTRSLHQQHANGNSRESVCHGGRARARAFFRLVLNLSLCTTKSHSHCIQRP